jgi:hypothetical protein
MNMNKEHRDFYKAAFEAAGYTYTDADMRGLLYAFPIDCVDGTVSISAVWEDGENSTNEEYVGEFGEVDYKWHQAYCVDNVYFSKRDSKWHAEHGGWMPLSDLPPLPERDK